jgi:Zn-dependent peptidase ImmA (M78 family)
MKRQPSKTLVETVTAYRNGMTMKELADLYKVTVLAIQVRIYRYKMITGETIERGPAQVIIETVGEYRNGKTMKQLAAQYGVTQQNISYRVNTYRRLTGEIVRRNRNRS